MTLRTLMLAGPAKANELFARLADTSDGAVKTRERLFAELKAELELRTSLEEQHLFPVLRRNPETKVCERLSQSQVAARERRPRKDRAVFS